MHSISQIGDTWIQGASSDPLKVAQFRAISKVRADCVASGECNMNDADFQTFDRLLMKVGEHTWYGVLAAPLLCPSFALALTDLDYGHHVLCVGVGGLS